MKGVRGNRSREGKRSKAMEKKGREAFRMRREEGGGGKKKHTRTVDRWHERI